MHLDPALDRLPRAGLVHRLDKLTSGLLVVARNPASYHALSSAMQAREVHRSYQALVWGRVIAGATIEAPLGRHPTDRTRFAIRRDGRQAVTHYRVNARWAYHSLLDVRLQSVGFPLVGDPQYGRRGSGLAGASPELQAALTGFRRQALHARKLGFSHPTTGEQIELTADLPADLQQLIAALGAPE